MTRRPGGQPVLRQAKSLNDDSTLRAGGRTRQWPVTSRVPIGSEPVFPRALKRTIAEARIGLRELPG
jgi:hypothetical protein